MELDRSNFTERPHLPAARTGWHRSPFGRIPAGPPSLPAFFNQRDVVDCVSAATAEAGALEDAICLPPLASDVSADLGRGRQVAVDDGDNSEAVLTGPKVKTYRFASMESRDWFAIQVESDETHCALVENDDLDVIAVPAIRMR